MVRARAGGRRRQRGAASKTAMQLGVIGLCLAVIPVILINNQRERAARLKSVQEKARKEAEEAAAQAKAPPQAAPAAAPAAKAAAGKPATPEIKPLGPRDEKAIALQKASLARPWGKDPFHSAGTASSTSKAGALTLKGIAYRPSGKSFAMINEAILREGEEIEGNHVVKIERRQVTLNREGREFILRLEEEQPAP